MEEQIEFRNQEGELLDGRIHVPEQPSTKAAIVCHGFSGTKNLIWIHNICGQLAKQGVAALRFDFSGHGDSEGKFPDWTIGKGKRDLAVALEVMKERGYKEFALVGHSAGAAVCLLEAPHHAEAKCIVAIACPAEADREENEEYLRKVYAKFGCEHGRMISELSTLEILENTEKIDVPTLIIHGTDDEVIPVTDADLLMDMLHCEKQQELIEGGNHVLLAEANKVEELTTNWITKHL